MASSSGHNRLFEHDSRPLISTQSASSDRVESPSQDHSPNLRDLGSSNSGHVHNTHLPQFMSRIPELQALAIDALSQDWQGQSMYMFPPFPLLKKVIQKLCVTQEGEIILIVPGSHQSRGSHTYSYCVWTILASFYTTQIYSHNRDSSRTESRTICTHGGSHAALPSIRLFRGGL